MEEETLRECKLITSNYRRHNFRDAKMLLHPIYLSDILTYNISMGHDTQITWEDMQTISEAFTSFISDFYFPGSTAAGGSLPV